MASGLLNTSQQVGAALGLAVLVAAATVRTQRSAGGSSGGCVEQAQELVASLGNSPTPEQTALTEGFQYALLLSIGFAIAGVLVALFVVCESDCREAKARALQKDMT